jgi:hypothetical protein
MLVVLRRLRAEERDAIDRLVADPGLPGMGLFRLSVVPPHRRIGDPREGRGPRDPRNSSRATLTQAEVARRLGVSVSYIAVVEAGGRNLTLGQLADIANAMRLGIDVTFIRPNGTPVRAERSDAAGTR